MSFRKPRIVLYGHFGSGNIGNDSSLEAMLHAIKRYQPTADVLCICNGPQFVKERFGIETLSIGESQTAENGRAKNRIVSLWKKIWLRLFQEMEFWMRRPSWFQVGDQFIVVGTGAVDDMAVKHPWHAPYELYKWCRVAKWGKARLIFLSVGVGPIVNPLSRFLMLNALKMADYRSYRETIAVDYLQQVGFKTNGDSVYPDLVFSLDKQTLKLNQELVTSDRVVGLGLINYYGWKNNTNTGEAIYREYISKIQLFVSWLLENDCSIRILVGDNTDERPVDDIMNYVRTEMGPSYLQRIIAGEISTVEDLFEQIAQTSIVVASRFHNVLCALMLEKPVISLGYHEKNEALMREIGLHRYCQHIEHFTLEQLVEQFNSCDLEKTKITRQIHDCLQKYRDLLDEQYDRLLSQS